MLESLNAGMPENSLSGIYIFTVSQLRQSGTGIPALVSVRYRWSRISLALPCFC
jgi:hypothetical protein